jgi:DNA (cytosine-5)-methyltransferase 1
METYESLPETNLSRLTSSAEVTPASPSAKLGGAAAEESGEARERQRDGDSTDDSSLHHAGIRRAAEPTGQHRSGASDHDCRASGVLADPGDGQFSEPRRGSQSGDGAGPAGADVPDALSAGLEERGRQRSDDEQKCAAAERSGGAHDLAHAAGDYRRFDQQPAATGEDSERRGTRERRGCLQVGNLSGTLPPFAPGPSDPRWPAILRERPDLAPALESPLRRVAPRIPDWLDRAMSDRTKRLKALGNAVVPACAEWVGRRIMQANQEGV